MSNNCNFKIYNDGTFGNNCHKEEGTCCCNCKYGFEPPKDSLETWIPCSDFCMKLDLVKSRSCLDCKHKPKYMIK